MEKYLSIISKLFVLCKPFYWREIYRIKKELILFGASNHGYMYEHGLTCNVPNTGSIHYKRAIFYLIENSFVKESKRYPSDTGEAVILLKSTKTKKKIDKVLKKEKEK